MLSTLMQQIGIHPFWAQLLLLLVIIYFGIRFGGVALGLLGELGITLLSDTDLAAIRAYDVWKEKKNYGKVSMGVVRTTYMIDKDGTIIFANDKVKAAEDAARMIGELSE